MQDSTYTESGKKESEIPSQDKGKRTSTFARPPSPTPILAPSVRDRKPRQTPDWYPSADPARVPISARWCPPCSPRTDEYSTQIATSETQEGAQHTTRAPAPMTGNTESHPRVADQCIPIPHE